MIEVLALGAAGKSSVAPSERTPLHRRAFAFEQSRLAYGADFVVYGAAIAGLAGWLLWSGQGGHAWRVGALVLLGAVVWSGLEYALHRFVLHRVQPFRAWHEAHHRKPRGLIGTPTIVTVILFTMLVFLPSWAAFGLWPAQGLTLGLLGGYLAYSVLHHGMHHWPARGAWLRQRRRWHALHHGSGQPACYGVSTGLWDRLCGTAPPARVGNGGRLAGGRADRPAG